MTTWRDQTLAVWTSESGEPWSDGVLPAAALAATGTVSAAGLGMSLAADPVAAVGAVQAAALGLALAAEPLAATAAVRDANLSDAVELGPIVCEPLAAVLTGQAVYFLFKGRKGQQDSSAVHGSSHARR